MAQSHALLHPQVCAVPNLFAAARAAMQGKLGGRAAATFYARWETHAVAFAEELRIGAWRPGPYTYFDIHEPKLRRVAAAPFRDRVVHHALVRVIEPIFEKKFIEDSYACRKGKGTHAGVRRCAQFARRFPTCSNAISAATFRVSITASSCNALEKPSPARRPWR